MLIPYIIYTPGIYAEIYTVFVFLFVRSFFRSLNFRFNKVLVKVSPVVYISVTAYQKAILFESKLPLRVVIYITTPDSRVPAPG